MSLLPVCVCVWCHYGVWAHNATSLMCACMYVHGVLLTMDLAEMLVSFPYYPGNGTQCITRQLSCSKVAQGMESCALNRSHTPTLSIP